MISFVLGFWLAADPSAAEIMVRVAENQARAQELRKSVVYHQTVLARMHRSRNKLAREEYYEFQVLPTEKGIQKQRLVFKGKYERRGTFYEYDRPNFEYKEIDIDGNLISELVDEFTDDKSTKDGINEDLFPLTRDRQQHYDFKLAGRENYADRDVWKVIFTPKKGEEDEAFFGGEALIDTAESQPILVSTYQAKGVPLAVKILLGTNIRQVGFKVAYKNFGDGLWFPVTYGGEFDIRVLFGYHRKISISLKNSDLKRTDVKSGITYATENR